MYNSELVSDITKLKLHIATELLKDKNQELADSIESTVNSLCTGVATISDINNNVANHRLDILITHSGSIDHNINTAISVGYKKFIEQNVESIPEDIFDIYKQLRTNDSISSLFNIQYINTGDEDEYSNETNCIVIL